MHVTRLWLADFRSYRAADISFAPGLTAVLGPNGEGKTNLLEAIAWLATQSSFRGATNDTMVRAGVDHAVIRAEVLNAGREVLIEAELVTAGRSRVQVNRQRLARTRDLAGALRVTVFSPDDLELVKGGPAGRRRFLDDTLVALHPRNDALRREADRVLRQRNALLRSAHGRLEGSAVSTLDVWDAKLVAAGGALAEARAVLVAQLVPLLAMAYGDVAGSPSMVEAGYDAPWRSGGLAAALAAARRNDLRRGVSTTGPHRDDLVLALGGAPARTHASQGEQRSLALALRLASHHLVTAQAGAPPVLLLDDVFSELDAARSAALVRHLPAAQTILTTAAGLPPGAVPDKVLRIAGSSISEGRGMSPQEGAA